MSYNRAYLLAMLAHALDAPRDADGNPVDPAGLRADLGYIAGGLAEDADAAFDDEFEKKHKRGDHGHFAPKEDVTPAPSDKDGAEASTDADITPPPSSKPATKVQVGAKAQETAKKLFGRELDEKELAALACAPDGATVQTFEKGGQLLLSSEKHNEKGELEFNSNRKIYKPWFGPLTCKNISIGLRGAAKGKGLEVFDAQVKQLQDLGVKRIVCDAAGGPSGGGVGYFVWPRFGYGGAMSSQQIAGLPDNIRKALGKKTDVLDLFELPGGPEAWKAHGSGIKGMSFDLAPGSRNLKALEKYKAERATRGS